MAAARLPRDAPPNLRRPRPANAAVAAAAAALNQVALYVVPEVVARPPLPADTDSIDETAEVGGEAFIIGTGPPAILGATKAAMI
mmetsp:Transcript_43029/g.125133  ORF Transcript_43029/g.125133 Transcript_43029/m.125133 type:complete len:85 (+) Transcript_43029:1470-1724(+)